MAREEHIGRDNMNIYWILGAGAVLYLISQSSSGGSSSGSGGSSNGNPIVNYITNVTNPDSTTPSTKKQMNILPTAGTPVFLFPGQDLRNFRTVPM
jgi:hypothetical protein